MVQFDWFVVVEQVGGLEFDPCAVVDEDCLVVEGAEGADGGPGELVAEGVVAEGRGGQAAAPTLVLDDLPTCFVGLIDDLHGGEVVDARIEAQLIEEDESLLDCLVVELVHSGADVRGSHEMFLLLETDLRHVLMQEGGDIAHHHIDLFHQGTETVPVLHVHQVTGASLPILQSKCLDLVLKVTRDEDLEVGVNQ